MTEVQLRAAVVSAAKAWIGCKESNGTHKPIIDLYNGHKPLARKYKVKYTDAWCATYVSAVFIKSGLTDIAPTECSCNYMIERYAKLGRWKETDSYKPSAGDVIFYDWDDTGSGENKGSSEHVGLVVSVTGNTIKVIEGNMDNAVGYRTLQVNGRYIRGYGLPNYASKAKKATSSTAIKAKADHAKSLNTIYAKTYTVNTKRLNMRSGAGTTKPVIMELIEGDKVTCYGYYTKAGSTIWLLVQDSKGTVGYCSKGYLK